VMVVEFTTVTPLTATPPPPPATATVDPVVKFVPVRVTGTAAPRAPALGETEVRVAVGGFATVKATVLLVPFGVVMDTVLPPVPAVEAIVSVAVTVVLFTPVRPLTVNPEPETVIAVAPVRLVPVSVTGTDVPRVPDVGEIEVRVGTGPAVTVKATVLLVPLGVVTDMVLPPVPAVEAIVSVAVAVVAFTTVRLLTVNPVAGTTLMAVVPVRKVPVSVIGTAVPRIPEVGVIDVRVGTVPGVTVKLTVLLVPFGVVIDTVLVPPVPALDAMTNVAVTVVLFTTVRLVTVNPVTGRTLIAVAPVRLVPVKVTGIDVPRSPEVGAMDVRVGAGGIGASIAPTSTGLLLVLRGLL